jgi:ribosomal protein S18 acetylase RimI-like enzyme
MTSGAHVTVDAPPSAEDRQAVAAGLLAFNVSHIGDPHAQPMGVFIRDAAGTVKGGLLGLFRWRWLYVEKLWVDESLRGQGHGTTLMREAERFAREREAMGVHLDTFEFQALPFYEKLGYEVFGVHEGYPAGLRQYHLKKDLPPAAGSGEGEDG